MRGGNCDIPPRREGPPETADGPLPSRPSVAAINEMFDELAKHLAINIRHVWGVGQARSANQPNTLLKRKCADGLLQSETLPCVSLMSRVLSVCKVSV